jgi:hypothetical protein
MSTPQPKFKRLCWLYAVARKGSPAEAIALAELARAIQEQGADLLAEAIAALAVPGKDPRDRS